MRTRGIGIGLMALISIVVAAVYLSSSAWQARRTLQLARAQFERGDLSDALGTLRQLENSQRHSADSLMLKAKCYRWLRHPDDFAATLEAAKSLPDAADEIGLESSLMDIQAGKLPESIATQGATETLQSLVRQGAEPLDAGMSLILGCLAAGDEIEPRNILRALEDDASQSRWSTQLESLSALVSLARGDELQAEQALHRAIARGPRNELAFLALAELYALLPSNPTRLNNPEKCVFVLEYAAKHFPNNREVVGRLAQAKRFLGDSSSASVLIQRKANPTRQELVELAHAESDRGNYQRALEIFAEKVGLDELTLSRQIDESFQLTLQTRSAEGRALIAEANSASVAYALGGQPTSARSLFAQGLDRVRRTRRIADLKIQLAVQPRSAAIVNQLDSIANLSQSTTALSNATGHTTSAAESVDSLGIATSSESGHRAYREHCEHCHGIKGDGRGRAAHLLFPKPTSFVDQPMRYVSAINGLATDEDLRITIEKGLQGVSMPAFSHLSRAKIDALVKKVRQFQRAGLVERYRRFTHPAAEGDSIVRMDTWIYSRLVPSEVLQIPTAITERANGVESSVDVQQSRALAKELFARVGCAACHAVGVSPATGTASLFDSLGYPIQPRHFRREPFRRGASSMELYRRILLGMPGTPHPATIGLTDMDTAALISYVQEAAGTAQPPKTNYQRWFSTNQGIE